MSQCGTFVLERSQFVPASLEEVFAFFAEAGNLQRITPAFLDFHIVTPQSIDLRVGTQIEYRLKLFSIPFRWKTLIDEFSPPYGFVDLQTHGPYQLWHHSHRFEVAEGGTWIFDRVTFRIGWGPVGTLAYWLFVRRTLERIFDYRRSQIEAIFINTAQSELPSSCVSRPA